MAARAAARQSVFEIRNSPSAIFSYLLFLGFINSFFRLSYVFAKVYNHNMNKWKNVTVILGLLVCAMWFAGCASKPVEEGAASEDEYKREKNGERVALVMVDETGQELTGEENLAVEDLGEPEAGSKAGV